MMDAALSAAVLTKLVRTLAAILTANNGMHPASKATHEQVCRGHCFAVCGDAAGRGGSRDASWMLPAAADEAARPLAEPHAS